MRFLFKCLTMATVFFITTASASPKVVVTILPIHSLTADIMAGVDTPTLLLPPNASPHDFQLRPSDAKKVENADLVIWVGHELETYLEKPLENLVDESKILTLMDLPDLKLLPFPHDHDHHEGHDHHHHTMDPHLWLDPIRSKTLVLGIEKELSRIDPKNTKTYHANADKTVKKLDALYKSMNKELQPVSKQPFLVFHEGYQYLEKTFHLNSKGSLIENPHGSFSLKRLKLIREKVKNEHIVCVFGEPHTQKNLLNQFTVGTDAKTSILDPLGANIKPGTGAYFQLMEELSHTLKMCLN